MGLLRTRLVVRGAGWQAYRQKLRDNLIGAKQMAQSRWLIGSTLPYASHWIEEGWRNDPRYGHVTVHYRTPATWFMREAVAFMADVRKLRPSRKPVGVIFSGTLMMQWANTIARNMQAILNQRVYSAPVPTRNGRPRYERTHVLFNSIRAYRA